MIPSGLHAFHGGLFEKLAETSSQRGSLNSGDGPVIMQPGRSDAIAAHRADGADREMALDAGDVRELGEALAVDALEVG